MAPFTMHFPWSTSVDMAHEIAGHNADDAPTLRAMSLVSQATRSSVLRHLFSTIHFACVEDFSRWLDILSWTRTLATAVKKVKFPDQGNRWLGRHRGLKATTPLGGYAALPVIPPSPSVWSIEWYVNSTDCAITMMFAHMASFPNTEKLHFRSMGFNFAQLTNLVSACAHFKILSFHSAILAEENEPDYISSYDTILPRLLSVAQKCPERVRETPFDLIALEDLAIRNCASGTETLVHLIQHSQSRELGTLALEVYSHEQSFSVHGTEKLMRFSHRLS
ncbi:hypothetical protein K438DRAFT_725695 [Mycena galopus ATCC 62051]|nr:hypothetical protein K438DRAFT_725695 [Mycena galopus ATCC 62051]